MALGAPNRYVLHPAVAMVNKPLAGSAGPERLLEGIEREVAAER
jgi:hypothetical protein